MNSGILHIHPVFHPAAAPEHCFDAGDKFHHSERFCHIVVSSQCQSVDLINFSSLGCKHDNGIGVLLPDKSAQLQAIHLRHHDIQNRQIHLFLLGTFQGLTGVVEFIDLESFVFQIQSHQICNFLLVIHH